MVRAALYRLGPELVESLRPILACTHSAGSYNRPSSPEVEQQSSTQPCKVSNTHNGSVACFTVRGREDGHGGPKRREEMRKGKRKEGRQCARVLLRIHHLPFAVLI